MEPNALARLKRLAGKSTLILTHYGRKSGKPHEVKIWFVVDGDKVFIGTADVRHQWIKNVQKNPRIKLSVGGEKFEAEARFLDDPAERNRAPRMIVPTSPVSGCRLTEVCSPDDELSVGNALLSSRMLFLKLHLVRGSSGQLISSPNAPSKFSTSTNQTHY